ncbi:MAG: antibiotic biosynthesis monooxygenase [Chloroflexi bacterium]|nr:antibiotic biosynthesis monooxygenase [Chloroflexota bacterium]
MTMFVRLVRFGFGAGKHAAAEALAAELVPAISEQKGCNHVSFFGDADDGEYGLMVHWETKADAAAAAAVIQPRLQAGLAGNVKAPPDIRLFEVIESRR